MSAEYDSERCETCRFWDQHSENPDVGWCVRYPPVAISANEYAMVDQPEDDEVSDSNRRLDFWTFPTVHASTHCGEWQARKPLPVVPSEGKPLSALPALVKRWRNEVAELLRLIRTGIAEDDTIEVRRDAGVIENCANQLEKAIAEEGAKADDPKAPFLAAMRKCVNDADRVAMYDELFREFCPECGSADGSACMCKRDE